MAKRKANKDFKNFLDGVTKSIHGYYKTCETCGGTGKVDRYPYYATMMPPIAEVPCEDCKGRGRIFVVPNGVVIVREADIR
jgi:DnaJ-class molecular chaperone